MTFENLSVLVIDDSPFFRRLVGEILRSVGVGRVVVARDGAEAIGMMRKGPSAVAVDLVMADFLMAPVDGAMLVRWLRNGADSPDRFMPCIMVSAEAGPQQVRDARDFGATEFLAKPISVGSVNTM